jgi:hypothetical protein
MESSESKLQQRNDGAAHRVGARSSEGLDDRNAAEIFTSCGLVSRVSFTEASILPRKQSGRVHYVESGVKQQNFGDSAHNPSMSAMSMLRPQSRIKWRVRAFSGFAKLGWP